jgi:hypothetical protein
MLKEEKSNLWIPFFFGLAACSFMPHWSCHYYRIETGSNFVIGNIHYSNTGSFLSILFYTLLIGSNLLAISFSSLRFVSALISGWVHMGIGLIHLIRLTRPFPFEVFGYQWPPSSSIREMVVIIPFGVFCTLMAINEKIRQEYKILPNLN